jgi:tripartite-type tricarboxylate transporter receptor subunit TctC
VANGDVVLILEVFTQNNYRRLNMKRRTLVALSILSLSVTAALTSTPVVAQQYPDKPVKIIVSFAPGGATDVVARKLAQKFQEIYKQPFIVENRPGAGGTLGTSLAARAKPDGYT